MNIETNEIEDVLRDFERVANKVSVASKISPFKEINRDYKKRKERQKRKLFIEGFDQEKLGCFALKSVVPFDDVTIVDDAIADDNVIVIEDNHETFLLDRNQRKKQILLGYAVLNLNPADCEIPKTILRRCAKEDTLLPVEKDFIYYLWKNSEKIPQDLFQLICNNFGFLYEKPILRACCKILQTGEIDFNEELKKIAKLSELSGKIAAIFCDLYFLSGKNEKILSLYRNFYQ